MKKNFDFTRPFQGVHRPHFENLCSRLSGCCNKQDNKVAACWNLSSNVGKQSTNRKVNKVISELVNSMTRIKEGNVIANI